MDLFELARQCPQMSVTVKLEDLLTAGEQIARRVKDDAEHAVSQRAAEVGDRLIPGREARIMLGSPDPATMYRWSRRGYLTPVKIGTRNYYKAVEIEAIIRNHENPITRNSL